MAAVLAAALAAAPVFPPPVPANELPDLGTPADLELSPAQEARLGESVLRRIRAELPLVEDTQLDSYIQALGERLLAASPSPHLRFTFLIARNRAVNAFAATGGVIVIYSGLIEAAHSEAELAAVMAHEIAHITQRHIARTLQEHQRLSLPTLLAVLSGIAIGTHAPQVGSALTAGAVAGNLQTQLNFSRAYEREADAIGIGILARAGYPPQAMASFFDRLAHSAGTSDVPELLRTHPVTSERIAEAEARAQRYHGAHAAETPAFAFAKARLQALLGSPRRIIDAYTHDTPSEREHPAVRYRYALALQRAGRAEEATRVLGKLVAEHPNNLALRLALADSTNAAGHSRAALRQLRELNDLYPQQEPVVTEFARLEIEHGHAASALRQLRALAAARRVQPQTLRLEASAAAHAGQPALSHETLARYYFLRGATATALEQLDVALKTPGLPASDEARLRSLRRQLQTRARNETME